MSLLTNAAFDAHNSALSAQPIYVFEIVFNAGLEGVENVNDIYFGSDDISTIVNFPYPDRYYPLLDFDSLSGMSQKVDPINGVSSIGTISVDLIDYDNQVSSIIKAAADIGQGLRRQLCQVYKLFAGMDWADAIKSRTVFVDNLVLKSTGGKYHLTASDSQKQLKTKVFKSNTTVLNAVVAANGQVDVDMLDAVGFPMVPQPYFGIAGVCFFQLGDEILMATAKAGNVLTVEAGHRGMFATTPAAHDIYSDAVELIVLHENPITMALKIMTSSGVAGANGAYDALPKHWGASFEKVNVAEWLAVAPLLTGLNGSLDPLSGMQFEFVMDKSTECKTFIESEICKIIGCFPRIKGDGSLGLVAYNDLANIDKHSIPAENTWTTDDIMSWGDLDYGYKQMFNSISMRYNEFPKLSNNFTRPVLFTDSASYDKWGETPIPEYTTRGMLVQDVAQVYNRFQVMMARYSRPPLPLKVTALPKFSTTEVGDIRRIQLPLHDLLADADLDRAFEVLRVNETLSGAVTIELIAQPEQAAVDFSAMFKPLIADVAYQVGTQSQAPGSPLTGPHVFNDGDSLSGQVWFDGDVVIPFGVSVSISGDCEIRATGTVTVEGTIAGVGTGSAGISSPAYVNGTIYPNPNVSSPPLYAAPPPPQGVGTGFVAAAGLGHGGAFHIGFAPGAYSYGWIYSAGGSAAGASLFTVPPLITPILGDKDPISGLWRNVSGLPILLSGVSGGYGMGWTEWWPVPAGGGIGGDGGGGGAGLLIMARGIFVNGQINVRGGGGGGGVIAPTNLNAAASGGGGGGGGSVVLLAERDFSGLPALNLAGTIDVAGGDGGLGVAVNPRPNGGGSTIAAGPTGYDGATGAAGAVYIQVIG